jgi:hypothetical protein
LTAREIHQNLTHQPGREGEEVRLIAPLSRGAGHQPDKRFFDKRGGLLRMSRS